MFLLQHLFLHLHPHHCLFFWHFRRILLCTCVHRFHLFSSFHSSLSHPRLSVFLPVLPLPIATSPETEPLIIYELPHLSWQQRLIPTGFNHGCANEISMANAHGSPSLSTGAPCGRWVPRMRRLVAGWANEESPSGSTWASLQTGEGNIPGKEELAMQAEPPDKICAERMRGKSLAVLHSRSRCSEGCGKTWLSRLPWREKISRWIDGWGGEETDYHDLLWGSLSCSRRTAAFIQL